MDANYNETIINSAELESLYDADIVGCILNYTGSKYLNELKNFADETDCKGSIEYNIALHFSSYGNPVDGDNLKEIHDVLQQMSDIKEWADLHKKLEALENNFDGLEPKEFYETIRNMIRKIENKKKPKQSNRNFTTFFNSFNEIFIQHDFLNKLYEIESSIYKKSLNDLNNLDNSSNCHFVDENGVADKIAFLFSSKNIKPINKTQIRKFYSELVNIERINNWNNAELKLDLLKVKLLIATRRTSNGKKVIPIEFFNIINSLIDKIEVKKEKDISSDENEVGIDVEKSLANLKLFVRYFEAIVAFHKFYEEDEDSEESDIPSEEEGKYYDIEVIKDMTAQISQFRSIQELNNLEPLFYDEGGFADKIAYQFSKNGKRINPNQLRRFYGEIKNIGNKRNWEDAKLDFYMLKPRMLISVARKSDNQKLLPSEFYELIKTLMNKVKVENDEDASFKNLKIFVEFYESVVGFHKFHDFAEHEYKPLV